MGLLDILNGMQHGPRGQPQPTRPGSSSGGGMSPLMMALIGLLAYKAMKGFGGSQTSAGGPSAGGGMSSGAPSGGGLGDILGGLLGGRPASGGSGLPGGLSDRDLGNVLNGGLGN